MGRPKAWIAWSTGKDSAWALHVARGRGELDVVGMLATVTDDYGRVSMHGVREELVRLQAGAAGLALHRVGIPADCSNETYEAAMRAALEEAEAEGVTHVVFGDIFLQDLREWREKRMAEVGMSAAFPLWDRDTGELAREMIDGGLRAFITCLDPRKVPRELAGRAYDEALLDALPEDLDPCAERGEFHTFAWAGPMFREPVPVEVGRTVERGGFVFTDLVRAGVHEARPARREPRRGISPPSRT